MRGDNFKSIFKIGAIVRFNKVGLDAIYPPNETGKRQYLREVAEKHRFIVAGVDNRSSMVDHICVWVVTAGSGASRSSYFEGFLEIVEGDGEK